MSYDHRLVPVAVGALPNNFVLTLDGKLTGINSVTVYNNSPLMVTLYRGMESPMGSGLEVAPYQYLTIPASSVKTVAVGFSGNAVAAGVVDFQWTDQNMVALTSSIQPATSIPTGSAPFTLSTDLFLTPATTTFSPATGIGTLPAVNAGQRIYITGARVRGARPQSWGYGIALANGGANIGNQTIDSIDGSDMDLYPASPAIIVPTLPGASYPNPFLSLVPAGLETFATIVGQLNMSATVTGYVQ